MIRRNTTVTNLQKDVFFMRAQVTGQVFRDINGNGRQTGTREMGVAGVTIELLDDEANVLSTTVTDHRGSYRFDAFHETGTYQLRLVIPDGQQAATVTTREIRITRGDETVRRLDFGLADVKNAIAAPVSVPTKPPLDLASLDAAFAAEAHFMSFVPNRRRSGRP